MGEQHEHVEHDEATKTRTDEPAKSGDEGQGATPAGDGSTDGERDQPTE